MRFIADRQQLVASTRSAAWRSVGNVAGWLAILMADVGGLLQYLQSYSEVSPNQAKAAASHILPTSNSLIFCFVFDVVVGMALLNY
jgi:hypothetical protein